MWKHNAKIGCERYFIRTTSRVERKPFCEKPMLDIPGIGDAEENY
ncbi:MAG: hypothetical protein QM576_07045 [Rhodopseudomonas sp.]